MPSFLLLYRGPYGDPSSAPPEQMKAVMDAWNAYFAKHGPAIKDGGNPTLPGASVAPNGKVGTANDVTGYSIVEANDMAGAKSMMNGHPHLMDAKNSIDIYEIMPIGGG